MQDRLYHRLRFRQSFLPRRLRKTSTNNGQVQHIALFCQNFCNISHANCMNLRRSHFCEGQLQSGGLVCKECGELCSLFDCGSVPRNNAPAISRSIIAINTVSSVFIDISYPEWGERYCPSAYFPPNPFERNFCRATREDSQVPAHLQAVGPHL